MCVLIPGWENRFVLDDSAAGREALPTPTTVPHLVFQAFSSMEAAMVMPTSSASHFSLTNLAFQCINYPRCVKSKHPNMLIRQKQNNPRNLVGFNLLSFLFTIRSFNVFQHGYRRSAQKPKLHFKKNEHLKSLQITFALYKVLSI